MPKVHPRDFVTIIYDVMWNLILMIFLKILPVYETGRMRLSNQ